MTVLPNRKTIRLQHYDYRSVGVYHVTICAHGRRCVFGTVENGVMRTNELGELAEQEIMALSGRIPETGVLEYVVMPNHVHMLIGLGIGEDNTSECGIVKRSLGQIVNAFKGGVSRKAGYSVWQPRFYEHIIRNEQDLLETMSYIRNNPKAWDKDDLFIPPSP